jgi:integrase/recombinase XerD
MKWQAKLVTHKGLPRIAVYFEKNKELNERIKRLEGALWSASLGAWHLPDTPSNRTRFKIPQEIILSEKHLKSLEYFKQWLSSKRYSDSTIKTYCEALKSFLLFYNEKDSKEITEQDVVHYNNQFILKNQLSSSYQNQIVNAIKLFFGIVNNSKMKIELIHRPKREKLLPNVLSKEEVKMILEAHGNIKHRVMLSLIYSCGLRCGELLSLKPNDIDSKRGVVIIRQAKGRKDRIAPLSLRALDLLREYYKSCKPKVYLFEGQESGEQYDSRSLQQVLKQALVKAKISKPVTLHWLRHSYATHLLESGTDLRYIQEILGHRSSKTTEIYTHVSTKSIQQIVSPFDNL